MQDDSKLEAYDYHLPEERIAQAPAARRDDSRLLVLDRGSGRIRHLRFGRIDSLFTPGDLLVINDTRVFPARLQGRKESGGQAEVFLLGYPAAAAPGEGSTPERPRFRCESLIKASRPPKPGSRIHLDEHSHCTVLEPRGRGRWLIELRPAPGTDLEALLEHRGEVPLPPYIKREQRATEEDRQRYQTVYARRQGAVAAPTAGLHFTGELLASLRAGGVETAALTLHVGYGTFAPVHEPDIRNHRIHREYVDVPEQAAAAVNRVKAAGGRVWAVGTTTVRALESCTDAAGRVSPRQGWCELYITPGYTFKAVDNLITNFHLPRSSLLFLVAALCGRKTLLDCYRTALEQGYRFYSYGDAMAIMK